MRLDRKHIGLFLVGIGAGFILSLFINGGFLRLLFAFIGVALGCLLLRRC